ncbi:unnamed protein product (macronuclear) [Paramecium tetraurelia]|uniref:Cytochrome b5 heme-binding domain-containing protein n=1 Tax=Paramecium tetraurelia TaxID=5888 RepID=A0CJD6_PARTE|nr:uncharacterized protein GSPATT00000614001 [Paramecium tetraurelia]CAK70903.1 unnamed protein product [Paramecium tetraurelia]|eukprot:XP_001438300.1 hypothetical protein (macronuclear) [Paramecium tetraurelia strain d4-2]
MGSIILVAIYVVYQIFDYRSSIKRAEENTQQGQTEEKSLSPPNPEKLEIASLKVMTLKDVQHNNGLCGKRVFVAIKNFVFDVTNSDAYKPDGPYGVFAGHDISISLGKMNISEEFLDMYGTVTQPEDEIANMNSWFSYFYTKYPVIGRLDDKKQD